MHLLILDFFFIDKIKSSISEFLWMQHPWNDTVRIAIDLEAMGIGGKSSIFQVYFADYNLLLVAFFV